MNPELNSREKEILQAIIQQYIATAEPVGSRTLEKYFHLGISSATIRNVMADLEERGFIEQPHTSAGRVPTNKGYRYYVDYLLMVQSVTIEEKEKLEEEHLAKIKGLDMVLQETSKVLSLLSHQMGIVISPSMQESRCQHLELVRLTMNKVLLISVSSTGQITHKIIRTENDLSQETLTNFSRRLLDKARNCSFSEIKEIILSNLYQQTQEYHQLSELAQRMLGEIFSTDDENLLFLDGSLNLIEYPEFHDTDKLKEIFTTLEEKKALIDIMKNCISGSGVKVLIGQENPYEAMKNCSLVTATYTVDGRPLGTLGIIGPTRMPYDKMISIVDFTAKFISKLIQKNNMESN